MDIVRLLYYEANAIYGSLLRRFVTFFIFIQTITIRIILSERHLEVNIANDTIKENEDNNP